MKLDVSKGLIAIVVAIGVGSAASFTTAALPREQRSPAQIQYSPYPDQPPGGYYSDQRDDSYNDRDFRGGPDRQRRPLPPGQFPSRQANQFVVESGYTRISYTASNIAGRAVLTYNGRTFSGDQISRVQSPLGTLVTVRLEVIPDLKSTTFTLIVPPVRLQGRRAARVRLIGLTATENTTIAGPPLGQGITYEVKQFEGQARFITS